MFESSSKRTYMIVLLLTALVLGVFIWLASGVTAGGGTTTEEPGAVGSVAVSGPEEPAAGAGTVRIAEVMPRNHAVLRDETGAFSDWIELENLSASEVDLTGWVLSDQRGKGWTLPEVRLGPGERLVIFADGANRRSGTLHTDFSLSPDETVYLFTPEGYLGDRLSCGGAAANHSVARDEYGDAFETQNATPGYANTARGYELFSLEQTASGPLIISEVMTSNLSQIPVNGEYYDWVEVMNVSDKPVELSDYYLSDHGDEPMLWRFPRRKLNPGAAAVVYCSGDETLTTRVNIHTCFSLNAAEEDLFLTRADGELADYVYLRGIPADGSMGRRKGEGGWFYYLQATPKAANKGGWRRISQPPRDLGEEWVFDGVKSVTVRLEAPGEIYYTVDGAAPTEKSTRYTGPFEVTGSCVVRAVAMEEGAAPSPVLSRSYLLNENHTLPVLSLVTDDPKRMEYIYRTGRTGETLPGTASFYEPGGGFTAVCGVSMRGHTSLGLPKKSLGIDFTGFADGAVEYDLYGTGTRPIAGLSVRAGQDYSLATIRDELFQDLCLEAGNRALAQHSRWCALYINGEYYGTYALKENYSRRYYADLMGTDRNSVLMLNSPVSVLSPLYTDVIALCRDRDMTAAENYELFCSRFDVDSLIDWILFEAYCCNSDVNGNIRYFYSETDGKWRIAFYDLDWTFRNVGNCFYNVVFRSGDIQIGAMIDNLLKNPEFRQALYDRCGELCGGILSNEHVLAEIDRQRDIIAPEAERDRDRWSSSTDTWERALAELRAFVTDNDMENLMMTRVQEVLDTAAGK